MNSDFTPSQTQRSTALLNQYLDVFAQSSDDLVHTSVTTQSLDTGDHPPVNLAPYSLPPANTAEFERQTSY